MDGSFVKKQAVAILITYVSTRKSWMSAIVCSEISLVHSYWAHYYKYSELFAIMPNTGLQLSCKENLTHNSIRKFIVRLERKLFTFLKHDIRPQTVNVERKRHFDRRTLTLLTSLAAVKYYVRISSMADIYIHGVPVTTAHYSNKTAQRLKGACVIMISETSSSSI